MKAKYHLVIFGWPEISLILVVMKQLGIGNCNSPADATWLLWMVSLQSLHPTSPFTGTAMHPGSYIPSLDTLGQLYSFAIMYDRPLRIRACATSLLLFKQVTRLQIYIWALLPLGFPSFYSSHLFFIFLFLLCRLCVCRARYFMGVQIQLQIQIYIKQNPLYEVQPL